MSFKDIKGHSRAVSFLKSSIAGGRLANAYIFYGPGGIGKKLAALNFAKAINCASTGLEAGSEGAGGCDNCPSCKKIDSLNHPDVRLTAPAKEGAAVKIYDIRALIKDVSLKPYGARKKVYIIDEADKLTEEAANALLKTLEEPSPDSILILITENLRNLLPTIRSRCQVITFFPLDPAVIKEILVESHRVDSVKAHVLSNLACGALSSALKLNDEDFFDKRAHIIKALSSDSIALWDFDKTPKADLKVLLNIMLTWYRDILVTKALARGVVNIDKEDLISIEAKRLDFAKLDNAIKRIISTQAYLDQNANPKLAMTALSLSL